MNKVMTTLLILLFSTGSYSEYSPDITEPYPNRVYWGDTHLHTNMSLDAFGMGNVALSPVQAYRFARGEAVTSHNGMTVRLGRPLDFLVIADHAENIGVMPRLIKGDPLLLGSEEGRRWYQFIQNYPLDLAKALAAKTDTEFSTEVSPIFEGGDKSFFWSGFGRKDFGHDAQGYLGGEAFRQSVWDQIGQLAENYNTPGVFTAFIGYEWTSAGTAEEGGIFAGNLHRVVIFKDGPQKACALLPFSSIDSSNPEDLWAHLAYYNTMTGGDAIAIPHNGNVSNGEMFPLQKFSGRPLDSVYAKTRSRWEPLYEVTQIKGDGEAHPVLSPTDEFADYETFNSWGGPSYNGVKTTGWQKRKESEYARSALKLGLKEQYRLGENPFKFGMIGSTDAHTSLAAVEENRFWGKQAFTEPHQFRALKNWKYAAAGYTAVWAHENTRESLFAAMKRKEVYATTGPRITVRFFGGWDYQDNDAFAPDLAAVGYAGGVPMGGDLTAAPKDKAPRFLIRALKDPDGANLDRIQVIKGWHDNNGELHEKVYNVALSDNRKPNKQGTVKPVGSTVDIKDASYTNTIGDTELAVVWEDPNFNAEQLAFYYLRVIEIPTPRWTAYDAKYFALKDIPKDVPMVTQERAYTSPIWFTP